MQNARNGAQMIDDGTRQLALALRGVWYAGRVAAQLVDAEIQLWRRWLTGCLPLAGRHCHMHPTQLAVQIHLCQALLYVQHKMQDAEPADRGHKCSHRPE